MAGLESLDLCGECHVDKDVFRSLRALTRLTYLYAPGEAVGHSGKTAISVAFAGKNFYNLHLRH